MTALTRPGFRASRLTRLGVWLRNATLGTLLTTLPVLALLSLGWLTRRMGHVTRARFGAAEQAPGWILGPHEAGRIARALGGLGANIRSGLMALTALLAWTLPFTLLWLGAWWAGWENSFNKGYEQAFVGPSVYLFGTLASAILLPVLPVMLAHLATEDRLSAAFELRRLRSVIAQSGWRLPALGALTLILGIPFVAVRGIITTAPEFFPGVEGMTPDQIAGLQGQIALAMAAFAFLSLWLLRALAARIYTRAAPRAAGLQPGLWDGAQAAEAAEPARRASRFMATLWYLLAMGFAFGLGTQILVAQFLDHAWWRWLFHPLLTLPWAG
ncbi:DUF4013 domain-containing protein [Tabrizicola sp.]|uniref:DUF4013 domain-containing protein n=1 Tax=Tabrizicola sp. TaxID=2005166 RepID=UPI00286BAEAF|nr:DUF4013 domain-containing protein [Tabrizicola sp.]